MAYQRVSPGVYRDTRTGKTVNSVSRPGASDATRPVSGVVAPPGPSAPRREKLRSQEAGSNRTAQFGNRIATGILANYPKSPYDTGSLSQYLPQTDAASAQAAQDAEYQALSRDRARNFANDKQASEQELADRGIPYSQEQGSPYQQALMNLNHRYDDLDVQNRAQSIQLGNQKYAQDFDIANQGYNTRAGAYDKNYTMPVDVAGKLQDLNQLPQQNTQFNKDLRYKYSALKKIRSLGSQVAEGTDPTVGGAAGINQ